MAAERSATAYWKMNVPQEAVRAINDEYSLGSGLTIDPTIFF